MSTPDEFESYRSATDPAFADELYPTDDALQELREVERRERQTALEELDPKDRVRHFVGRILWK